MAAWRPAKYAAALLLIAFTFLCPTRGAAVCSGDCNGDNQVKVDELIKGVNIALGDVEVTACLSMDSTGDAQVTVSELVSAVNRALSGCLPPAKPERITALYNGYLVTVDPQLALAAESTNDRYRLYVLHAVLIDPDSGRIAAIFPALGEPAFPGGAVAHPISAYAALPTSESPPNPGISADQLRTYWQRAGVDEDLLTGAEWIDLGGAVATAGLTDTHFHVSSWSKKLPAEGERFGYYADLSNPTYYIDTSDWTRTCARDAMWRIVADANRHLVDSGDDGIFLHGYIYSEIDSGSGGALQAAYLYSSAPSCEEATPNPVYLINRVGAEIVNPPADPCVSDPGTWPPVDYAMLPALLVQTSGQSCWYNSALLTGYNEMQTTRGASVPSVALDSVASTGSPDGATWTLSMTSGTADAQVYFNARTPYQVDVVVNTAGQDGTMTVPFDVIATDSSRSVLTAQAMIPELATVALTGPVTSLQIKPFYRPIVTCIPKEKWDTAAAFWGETPVTDPVAYGAWDPRDPYATNWYNGSKRGLIQYFFDPSAQAWRPTGYAEHYPMRDALATVVINPPTVAELMEQRRRTATWCHRHGLTLVNDIMFYRRDGDASEFKACEALSYDHTGDADFFARIGLDPSVATGNLNLRVGLYYYVETGDDVGESVRLAHDATNGSDVDRLRAASSSPEYPGWVRWLGWKLQLDGAAVTRNSFTNAPLAKSRRTDPLTVGNEFGNQVTFQDHSYGLLTMTEIQEQVLTSRETAALYWLVRESDPASPFKNPRVTHDWSGLGKGVVNFLGVSLSTPALTTDFGKLDHVSLSDAQATQLAVKVSTVVEQVNDAWERTLAAIIRIWFERSQSPTGLPEMPSQTACHNSGDGAVDLWARAIKQLKDDVENLPTSWEELPAHWQAVIPKTADLAAIRRSFQGERFRIEHLPYISGFMLEDIKGAGGIDETSTFPDRNVVVSLQPAILAIDGGTGSGYPVAQELWPIPQTTNPWGGLPALPRYHLTDALTTFVAQDIPMTLNTDPPAMRDPRPALTVLGAVTRTPIEVDPTHWADQIGPEPDVRPPDYMAGKVYGPFGYLEGSDSNPLQLTIEQTLAAMTFWGAYAANMESEAGAIAVPTEAGQPGWFADLVVWRVNPLAITGPDGLTIDALGRMGAGTKDAERLATVNAFISKFLPSMTIVGGVPVYRAE